MARLPVTLGRAVPVHLVSLRVDDDDTVPETMQRVGQAIALDGSVTSVPELLFARRFPRGLATQGTQPNLPVM